MEVRIAPAVATDALGLKPERERELRSDLPYLRFKLVMLGGIGVICNGIGTLGMMKFIVYLRESE
jgi:hypothetical protein